MNTLPSNRERQTSAGNGKETNPDIVGTRIPIDGGTAEQSKSLNAAKSAAALRDVRTDEQLLEAYRLGDRGSFPHLVERYQRELFHFLVRFLGDRAAAEDVFQESFLQVHQ